MAVTSCAGANSFFKTDTVGHASRRPLISGRARHVCIFCLLMGWSGCDPAPAASDPYAGHQTQGARTLCGAHRAGPRDATSQKISRVSRSAKARRSTTPIIIPGTREASPLACDPSRPGAHDAFPVTQKVVPVHAGWSSGAIEQHRYSRVVVSHGYDGANLASQCWATNSSELTYPETSADCYFTCHQTHR